MSIISVDFISLENQIERLKAFAVDLEDTNETVHSVIGSLSDMELGDNDDELRVSYNRLAIAKEYLEVCILKLQKILVLYSECEQRILFDIDNLPLNMSVYLNNRSLVGVSEAGFFSSEISTFFGHSIVNDDWLEKLIFEKGGTLSE